MWKWIAELLVIGCLSGCASTGHQPNNSSGVEVSTVGSLDRVAVCVGLTAVDPAANEGWAGDCPGCDLDSQGVYNACVARGLSAILLQNSKATWPHITETVLAAASTLHRDDLLVLMFSGHGGQIADDNGDEKEDGLDETLCLWDGPVRDDAVLKLLQQLPAGVRVVLINDQCHAEGNFRSAVRTVKRAVSFGHWGKHQALPLIKLPRPSDIGPRTSVCWSGPLIQFAGCREAEYSMGSATGGTWTQSLLPVLQDAPAGLTWRQWFDHAAARMPSSQVPVWCEFGPVTDDFRTAPVLQ